MNKKTFLSTLKRELDGLPKDEITDILADYKAHFAEGKKRRRKEETIAKNLGSPKSIAKQLKAEYHIRTAENSSSARDVFRAIFATVGLGFFNLVIVLGPFLALVGVLIALFATGIGLGVSGLALLIASFFLPLLQQFIVGVAPSALGVFFLGVGMACLGALIFIGSLFVAKGFGALTLLYLRLNLRIIRGDEL